MATHARQVVVAVEAERFKRGHGEVQTPQITLAERESRIKEMMFGKNMGEFKVVVRARSAGSTGI